MAVIVGKRKEDGTIEYIQSCITGKPLEIRTKAFAVKYLLHKGYSQAEVDSLVFEGEDEEPITHSDFYVEEKSKKKKRKKHYRHNDGGKY